MPAPVVVPPPPPQEQTYAVSAEIAHENIEDELARKREELAQLRTVAQQKVVTVTQAEPILGDSREGRHRYKCVVTAVMMLVVLFVTVGVVLGVTLSSGSGDGSDTRRSEEPSPAVVDETDMELSSSIPTLMDETNRPSLAPVSMEDETNKPSLAPSVPKSRPEVFQEFLAAFSDPTAFQNASSPQYKALMWIANEDMANTDPQTDPQRVIERYVLAVLYFSTDGEGWNPQYDFLTFRSVCAWNGANTLGVFCDEDGNVADIDLSFNLFRGTLPSELQHLSTLTSLRFFSHFGSDDAGPTTRVLRGTIPTQLAGLSRLTYLEMRSNELSGAIPAELGNLSLLTHLSLESNNLVGTVPSEISALQNLAAFAINFNEITGDISPLFCDGSPPRRLTSDCASDDAEVPPKVLCDCCSSCCAARCTFLGLN